MALPDKPINTQPKINSIRVLDDALPEHERHELESRLEQILIKIKRNKQKK